MLGGIGTGPLEATAAGAAQPSAPASPTAAPPTTAAPSGPAAAPAGNASLVTAPPTPPTTLAPSAAPPTSGAVPNVPASSTTLPAPVNTYLPAPAGIPAARSYLLADLGTGKVLVQDDEHQSLPPASLTKMLVALVAENWLAPTDLIPVTPLDASVYPDRIGMEPGQLWPLDQVLQSLLIYSANDAAYALAQTIGGSLARFSKILQASAAEIGMADHPLYRDPAGLDGTEGIDGGNLLSARDVAIAARAVLAEPSLARIVGMHGLGFIGPTGTPFAEPSQNRAFLDSYPGSIGVKTGYTDPAGDCIAAAATRNGRTMLAVVMNGTNMVQTASMLLDEGFATPAVVEHSSDVLPPVRLPHPPPAAVTPSGAGPSPTNAYLTRLASGPGDPANQLRPEGGTTLGSLWPAPFAALVLAGVAIAAIRLRFRRSPLAHGRRR